MKPEVKKDKSTLNVFWFKRDLRLFDNDALFHALESDHPLLLLYVYEPSLEEDKHYSERHWRFVFESIEDLNSVLNKQKVKLLVVHAEVIPVFEKIRERYSIHSVYSTEETGIRLTFNRDLQFSEFCKTASINWYEFQNGGVKRGLRNRDTWRKQWYTYMSTPVRPINLTNSNLIQFSALDANLADLNYEYPQSETHHMQKGGRTEGKLWEDSFFHDRLQHYSDYISKPELARVGCSRLSPYLAWGCLSVREVYQRSIELKEKGVHKKQLAAFRSRLRWQAHFIQKFEMEPRIEFEAFNKGYLQSNQPYNEKYVTAWKTGMTGFPLVEASIRAVIETCYLNFRMRTMSVSFLLHHLFQHF